MLRWPAWIKIKFYKNANKGVVFLYKKDCDTFSQHWAPYLLQNIPIDSAKKVPYICRHGKTTVLILWKSIQPEPR